MGAAEERDNYISNGSPAQDPGPSNGSAPLRPTAVMADLVSVVIPTKNSASTLRECLTSVAQSTYRPIEVVVVDGNSTDDTVRIARSLGAKTTQGPFGRSTARRMGVSIALGAFLLFLDSDQSVTPDLISECVSLCRDERVDAVRLPERDLASGYWARCRAIDWQLAQTEPIWYPKFFRRSVYEAAGMHPTGLEDFMEDRDLFLRLQGIGARLGVSQHPLLNHFGRFNPLEFGIRRARASQDAIEYYRRHPTATESPWVLVRPRLNRIVSGNAIRWSDFPYVFGLLPYITVVYGPRWLRARSAWRRAGRAR